MRLAEFIDDDGTEDEVMYKPKTKQVPPQKMTAYTSRESSKLVAVKNLIQENCQNSLAVYNAGTPFLYRGVKTFNAAPFAFQATSPVARPPIDSSEEFQEAADEYFKSRGFAARRANSIYAIGSPSLSGSVYVIFPYDDAAFTWSPLVSDLYETVFETVYADLDMDNKEDVFAMLDSFKYQSTDLEAACKSKNEVMIHGRYVAVLEDAMWKIASLMPGRSQ